MPVSARFCGSCGSPVASGSPATVARGAPATAYGVTNASSAGVPVNASDPSLYLSGGGSGGYDTRGSGGGSGSYGTRNGGGGAGVPVNAAYPERYGGSPASSPSASRSYGGGSGSSPVTPKKTWEQVRCPGCGAMLTGRATVKVVNKEW